MSSKKSRLNDLNEQIRREVTNQLAVAFAIKDQREERHDERKTLKCGEVYTLLEVKEILKLSTRTVHRLVKSGQLPALKLGGLWRITEADLDALIKNQPRIKDLRRAKAVGE